jgi:hypothetical protein
MIYPKLCRKGLLKRLLGEHLILLFWKVLKTFSLRYIFCSIKRFFLIFSVSYFSSVDDLTLFYFVKQRFIHLGVLTVKRSVKISRSWPGISVGWRTLNLHA